ncbi:hypothetical protein Tco_0612340, partial [Tanacetum coccineum]
HAWRRLFRIRAPLVQEFILEFFSTCRIEDEMGLDAAGTLCFQLRGARCSMTWRQFILALGLLTTEEMAEDGFRAYWLGRTFLDALPVILTSEIRFGECATDQGAANVSYLLAQYLFRHAEGRKSDGRGLFVGTREIPLIDMGELVNLNICIEIGDDWAWVASRPDRQPDVAAGTLGAVEDAPAVDEGAQVDPAHVQAPQPPPPPPAAGSTMPQRLGILKEEM